MSAAGIDRANANVPCCVAVAALRIVWDVAVYRIARLEMANLVAAAAIVFALHAPPGEAAIRLVFGALLNLLVYLNNDFHDAEEDSAAPSKDADKTAFLRAHMGAAVAAQVFLLGALAFMAIAIDRGLFVPLIAGGGVCWAYSAVLKRRPYVDVLCMVVWGATMPAVAFSPDNKLGWLLVGLLALFSGAFESVQVIRDEAEDREAGVRTTAVALGPAATWWLLRGFIIVSAVYGVLLIHRWAGALPLLALLIPRTEPSRYWNLLRLALGLAFLGACAQVYVYEQSAGALLSLHAR